jgi:hypothetical protein
MKKNKIQVIKYSCCDSIFAACVEPDCYTDRDWLYNLRKYVLRGDIVEMIDSDKGNLIFSKCKCKDDKQIKINFISEKI